MSFNRVAGLVLVFAAFGCFLPQELYTGVPQCGGMPLVRGDAAVQSSLDSDLTVVSLNMARETDVGKIVEDIRKSRNLTRADVWLLQEVVHGDRSNEDALPELARAMGLNFVYAPADADDDGSVSGLAILSRYALGDVEQMELPRFNLGFRSRCRVGLAATVQAPSGPVRIFNVHLDTRINGADRVEQVGPVLRSAVSSSFPVVVGGDFNTSNFHWLWNVFPMPFVQDQVSVLRAAFTQGGFESPLDRLGATFRILWMPLSLDWIFPRGLRTVFSGVEPIDFSDHHAVWVSFAP